MHQKFTILDVPAVFEPEPGVIEILVVIEGGESATLRVDAFTAQKLIGKLGSVAETGQQTASRP